MSITRRSSGCLKVLAWTSICLTLPSVACGGGDDDDDPDASAQAGTGGGAGTGGTGGGTGGTGGAGGVTRCDRGIGAGGDGCADAFYASGQGFSIEPEDRSTGNPPSTEVKVRGTSFYTIPDPVLDVVQAATLERVDTGEVVEVTTAWTDSLTEDGHDVTLALTPDAPLDEGWYLLRIDGSLDTGHGTPTFLRSVEDGYEGSFRVGSGPLLLRVTNCENRVVLLFSELVELPAELPITVYANAVETACTRSDGTTPQAKSLELGCEGVIPELEVDVAIAEGIASPSGVALRNTEGQTGFQVSLSPGTTRCRSVDFDTPPAP